MESSESIGEGEGSLFDGMILFSPPASDAANPQSEPLDEDLFSDLTLQVPTPSLTLSPSSSPSEPGTPATSTTPTPSPSRQVSRKKKRAVRVGYARDAVSIDDEPHLPSSSTAFSSSVPLPPVFYQEVTVPPLPPTEPEEISSTDSSSNLAVQSEREIEQHEEPSAVVNQEQGNKEEESLVETTSRSESDNDKVAVENEEGCDSIEQKLAVVRAKILKKAELATQRAVSIMAKRKELALRRRNVGEELNMASAKYKELESELEEACEAEDFERAERISNSLASVENEKNQLLLDLRSAELDYQSVESDMQDVLDLHLSAEEEAGSLLQLFAKDATDYADLVKKNDEEKASKEWEGWQTSMELLETKKMEMDVESQVILEARSSMESAIDHLVEDDKQEMEMLTSKGDVLAKELADLLELVRLKELEIAQNDAQIQEVEKRISNVVSEFHSTQSSIKTRLDSLQAAQSKLDSESEKLAFKKKEIDDFVFVSEEKKSKLEELASAASKEASTCRDLVENWRNLVALIMQHRQDRIHFVELEEKVSQEIQSLRQQVADSREKLQELSSKRGSIQEEIVLLKQRASYIEKRGPELEAEKKRAAAARNFKEAGRIAAEAKALNAEKEQLQIKLEKATSDLGKLEDDIKATGERVQECEGLILVKEKEGAIAGYKRLQLVAASARAEREAALQAGDAEEAELILREAEVAESKARDLEETYHDLLVDKEKMVDETHLNSDSISSTAFIINLSSQHLAQIASSFTLSPEN
ncbi:myosin heavy chain, non-muscle [Carex littledalei]|uniref:Myosin heavy chain, non-muscle n=1 Tax=Carex littledalei TaxID=544730 RepID=A0A833VAQ7_9POAL|nr:myosin heavy chain, non-muscle [Carex littledalei]